MKIFHFTSLPTFQTFNHRKFYSGPEGLSFPAQSLRVYLPEFQIGAWFQTNSFLNNYL